MSANERMKLADNDWPPLKKALWDVIVAENVNDGHYIQAFALTEKLYAAALRAPEAADAGAVAVSNIRDPYQRGLAYGRAAAGIAAPPAVAYMSAEQMPAIVDKDDKGGAYIPLRKTPAGLFQLPLYAAPPTAGADAVREITVPLCESFKVIGIDISEQDLRSFEAALHQRGLNIALTPLVAGADAEMREALEAAIRCAKLALFVIHKQDVMPNSSWESGFNRDLKIAEDALAALSPDAGALNSRDAGADTQR